ncbi:Acetyl esterase/lipase [Ruaniaceae bacterium KH17]|nr:Acetyl esterase/lipase [Ruaniaceae bacterium KH17]
MSLHPAFQAYLDELNPLVEQAVAAGFQPTPESARAALAGLNEFAAPAVQIARVTDRVLEGVPVRVYEPTPGAATDLVYFIHGGGHMAGDLDVYDFQCRRVAAATQMVVVSVDYARAPEAPYPQGLEECYRVLQALSAGVDGVATTGVIHAVADSGGGAKLTSIAQRVARGEWTSPISRQVLLYPSLDYTMSGESMHTFATGHFLSAERVGWYFDNYFPEGTDRLYASPMAGPFNDSMPQTLVIAAEYDPLFSEAVTYVDRAVASGAQVTLQVAGGMIHAYAFFETKIPEEIEALYVDIAAFLTSER